MRGFPKPDYDADVRRAYRGGYTYVKPEYKEVDIKTGLVFDVNSLYPWTMHECKLPYGDPVFFEGEYQQDDTYNLYVQHLTTHIKLKEGYLPTIQVKKNFSFIPTEYITDSTVDANGEPNYEPLELWLTSVDLELLKEHYTLLNPQYINGWKFRSTNKLFRDYIDKWMKVKIESTKNGNKSMRTLSKLMLNALYGKFATKPTVKGKNPYYDDGVIKYTEGDEEKKKPIYIPVGVFVTSWARHKTITSAQKLYKYFVYADTDSLHLDIQLPDSILQMSDKQLEKLTTKELQEMGVPLPDDFEVDPVALGAWKLESKFQRARFIRQKSYCEDSNAPETWSNHHYNSKVIKEYCDFYGEEAKEWLELFKDWYDESDLKITCAGMPEACYKFVSWENFHEGAKYAGKLMPKHVKGGIVFKDIEFTIQKG